MDTATKTEGRTLDVTLTQPQIDFMRMTAKYPAFVGGYGSGKSEVMAIQAVSDALHSPSTLIGLYLPTYDLIKLITAPRIAEKLMMFGIRYRYNVQDHIFYTSSPQCGDFILRTMDNPSRIVGYETYRSHVDELDTLQLNKAKEVWQRIIARNRQRPTGVHKDHLKDDDVFNRVSAYSTPEGFNMVYHTWGKDPAEGYEMVTAPTHSNPYLPKDYVQGLRDSYPEALVDAYIEGKFVNLTSGTIYNMFDRHENGTKDTWDGHEPVYIGMDFNVGQMAAVIHVKRQGLPIAVDEIIDAYDTPEIIDIILERYQRCTIRVYPDASGGSRKSVNASKTDISLLQEAGFSVIAPSKNPPVKDRIIAMNKMFCSSNGDRTYKVNIDKCPTYADNLEQQIWGNNGEPDKKQGNDHTNDAGGYFISFDYPVIRPVVRLVTKFAM